MYPSYETGMRIAGGVWLNVVQESAVNLGKIGRSVGYGIVETSANLIGDWLPDRTFADVLDVVESVVEHPVSLQPE
jgi:hypothetical protein